MKLGVLDIGTNSIHMVLVEIDADGTYKLLDRFKDMTRLGDGTFTTHQLSKAAITRGLAVIRNMVLLARNKGFEQIEAVATSAVREADNGGVFIEEVGARTGLHIRVVTGEEEARLIYLGVRQSMEFGSRPSAVLDVGGGSVECIIGNRDTLFNASSLKLGAIRLKDLFLTSDPPSAAMLRVMQKDIDQQVSAALAQVRVRTLARFVCTSGMAGNIAEIVHLQRTDRPLQQMNLATVRLSELRTLELRLRRSGPKDRLAIPGFDPKRLDTLLPAVTVIRTVMERLKQQTMVVSDKAIRDGVIHDYVDRHREGLRISEDIPNVRRRNVILLGRRCRYPEAHSQHVANLALRLFDQTKTLHGLDDQAREWLEYAALLHDIGYVINPRQHHKHAYYLITHSDLPGLTSTEAEIIAQVARYHRKALPDLKHHSLTALPVRLRKTVMRLGALLRIADGLDRSHFSVVQDVDVSLGQPVVMTLTTKSEPALEIWTAQLRADLFEKVFRRPIVFKTKPTRTRAR